MQVARDMQVVVPDENIDQVLQAPDRVGDGRQLRVPLSFLNQRARWRDHNLGRMDIRCTGCNALHWTKDLTGSRRPRGGEASFQSCCMHGQVQIEPMRVLPEPLNSLMNGDNHEARSFREGLRRWNSIFAFTSIRFNMDNRATEIGGTFQLFQIHGALYHRQGPLVPAGGLEDARFSQIYLYDPADAARARFTLAPELNANLITSLTMRLHEHNPLIQLYQTARERFAAISEVEDNCRLILNPQLRLILERGADRRRENLPTANEVAIILPEEYGSRGFRDIVLARRVNGEDVRNSFTLINPNHALYLPLHYVLLFPYGEHGWHWGMRLQNPEDKDLKQRTYYSISKM